MINKERNDLISRFLSELKRRKMSRIQWYMRETRAFSPSSLNYFLTHYPQHERTASLVAETIKKWVEKEQP